VFKFKAGERRASSDKTSSTFVYSNRGRLRNGKSVTESNVTTTSDDTRENWNEYITRD
jgi:hypothetical protein